MEPGVGSCSARIRTMTANSRMVDWSDYAAAYDLLLSYNPAYIELLTLLRSIVDERSQILTGNCLDIGGGTGNFSRLLLDKCDCDLTFLEPDPGMMRIAKEKLSGVDTIKFLQMNFEELTEEECQFDFIMCTHALYTMPEPRNALKKIYNSLSSGGHLFIVDLGKVLNIFNWRLYLVRNLLLNHRLHEVFEVLRNSGPISSQNRRIRKLQMNGEYWTHSLQGFCDELAQIGFEVLDQKAVYRKYSHYALARKPN